ncbi:cell division topological specificity factor MinE [Helicobacter sp. MIT 99-5507]|uniref:cell division topological specificity factor MinE n=1 Tax=Helicobacter sp. MIT 99-5507 TaxID=152489 RepID=UPI000E1F9964|nr:cell division topological specificity factor MinE [Helicobacter sp. MIT 99-5507]RDU58028.1 cell division topological specificity factor MinE [Helicobacter sp. MIT 99-5507]
MFFWKKNKSADDAKNRLVVALAHDRTSNIPYMEDMKNEILAVIRKYTQTNKIDIKADSNQNVNMLEIEIILNEKDT